MWRLASAVSIMFVGAACGGNANPPPASLPAVSSEGDCESLPIPAACEWAESLDAVLIGTILRAAPITAPTYARGPGGAVLVEKCSSDATLVAFEVQLNQVDWLYGGGGQDPQTSVRIGAEQATAWLPTPSLDGNGKLRWIGATGPEPLTVGTRVGFAVTRTKEGIWSAMGEEPFAVSSSNQIIARNERACSFPFPRLDKGSTLDDFKAALRQCGAPSSSSPLRGRRANVWGRTPMQSYAALCIRPDVQSPAQCSADVDCSVGELCRSGACTAQ